LATLAADKLSTFSFTYPFKEMVVRSSILDKSSISKAVQLPKLLIAVSLEPDKVNFFNLVYPFKEIA